MLKSCEYGPKSPNFAWRGSAPHPARAHALDPPKISLQIYSPPLTAKRAPDMYLDLYCTTW